MIERVQQRRCEGEGRRCCHAVGLEREGKPEADKDNAGVLDRAVGEQSLEIALHHTMRRGL